MKQRQVLDSEKLPIGSNVIHNTTKEIGVVVGECLGYGKVKVLYNKDGFWYPQPKRNISLIIND